MHSALQEGSIGKLKLRNRIVYPPMVSNFCESSGKVTDRYIAYICERVKGGCGLIITEATMITPEGRSFPNQLGIHDDSMLDGLRRLTEAVHEYGGRIAVQLFSPGRQTSRAICGTIPLSPSVVEFNGELTGELSEREIEDIVKAYGTAAARAHKAGFDAVEVHGGNGYLLQQFHSRFTNRRNDQWGGSIENRTRFSREVIKEIRDRVPDNFPIILRLGVLEDVENGITPEEGLEIASILSRLGIDAFDVTAGMRECGYLVTPPASMPRGTHLELARLVRNNARGLPVIGIGRMLSLEDADKAIDDGMADFVVMGRAQIADPWLVAKSSEGRSREVAPCLGCNEGCMNRIANGLSMSCAINDNVGKEGKKILPADKAESVVVVGAGPAGVSAALTASLRGHRVILLEKESRAGGKMRIAALPPYKERLDDYSDYLEERIKNSNVEYFPDTRADCEEIIKFNPDRIILAVGAEAMRAEIDGMENAQVAYVEDALAMPENVLPEEALVVGGGMAGAECAEKLARAGCKVTIVETRSGIALDVEPRTRILLLKRLQKLGVRTMTSCQLERIRPGFADMLQQGQKFAIPFNGLLVLVIGYEARHELAKQLRAKGFPVAEVGDGDSPGNIMRAVRDGTTAGEA